MVEIEEENWSEKDYDGHALEGMYEGFSNGKILTELLTLIICQNLLGFLVTDEFHILTETINIKLHC